MPTTTIQLSDELRAFFAEEAEYETAGVGDTLEGMRGTADVEPYRDKLEVVISLWRAAETGRVDSHAAEIAAIIRKDLGDWRFELEECRDHLQDYVVRDDEGKTWLGAQSREENFAIYHKEIARLKREVQLSEAFLRLVDDEEVLTTASAGRLAGSAA